MESCFHPGFRIGLIRCSVHFGSDPPHHGPISTGANRWSYGWPAVNNHGRTNWSSRQGHFSPSLSQNRAWDSHLTRLFSFNIRRFLHIIELNLIIPRLLRVVFLSANEWAEPFAPFPLQKLLNYYDSVRHFITRRLPLEYLELHLRVRLFAHRNDSFSRSL